MGFLDVTIVNVAFPDIERDFAEASRADLSWVLNAYNIVFAALLVPAGRVADLVGRRRMFLIGVGAFVARVGAVRLGVLGRGAGGGARAPGGGGRGPRADLARPCCCRSSRPTQRATAVAIWSATGAVAAALGPSLGGVLVDSSAGAGCSS